MAVYWITGLSGAGKSTLATAMVNSFRSMEKKAILLDGDEVRAAIADPSVLYDRASRLINAYRISRLAAMFSKQQLNVVVATISLFHEVHQWNRINIPGYIEIWLKTPLRVAPTIDGRDRKHFTLQGPVMGVHIDPEFPLNADIELENDWELSALPCIAENIITTRFRSDSQESVMS
jgi:adenylylsulfate kinase-like enzyme